MRKNKKLPTTCINVIDFTFFRNYEKIWVPYLLGVELRKSNLSTPIFWISNKTSVQDYIYNPICRENWWIKIGDKLGRHLNGLCDDVTRPLKQGPVHLYKLYPNLEFNFFQYQTDPLTIWYCSLVNHKQKTQDNAE